MYFIYRKWSQQNPFLALDWKNLNNFNTHLDQLSLNKWNWIREIRYSISAISHSLFETFKRISTVYIV